MRLLLKNNFAFARQIRTPKSKPQPLSVQNEQPQQPRKTLKNFYQSLKSRIEKEDQKTRQDLKNTVKTPNPMADFQKIMEESENQQTQAPEDKQKTDINEKLKRLGTPQNLLSPQNREKRKKQVDSLLNARKREAEKQKFIQLQMAQSEFKAALPQAEKQKQEENEKRLEYQLRMAQQDLLLSEIMKNTKQKELAHINQQSDRPDEEGLTEKQKRLILREQKIIQALQNKQDPTQAKYQLTTQDILAMKYSPDIIAKARQYQNYELGYLKELIFNETDQTSKDRDVLQRRKLLSQEGSKYKQVQKTESAKKSPLNTYKSMKNEEGLQLYEDVQFYKNKAIKQIREKETLDAEDRLIEQSLKKDLNLGNKISDIFLDQVVYPEDAKLERKIELKETSFGKQKEQEKSIVQRLAKLGIQLSPQDLKTLSKENLFEDKKLLEEEQSFQKYLHKKEKKKNMKKELKEIHESVLRDDVDFDRNQQPEMTIKQLKQSNDVEMLEDNYEKTSKFFEQKQASFQQETAEEKKAKIHFTKTFRNMQGMLAMYFSNGLFNHGSNQLEYIQIQEIIPNNKNTVLNIFWNIEPSYLQAKGIIPGVDKYQELVKAEKKRFEVSLKKQSSYISGKMTQLLRLRYGPEVRFHYDRKTEETVEAVDQLKQFIKQIAMVEVEEMVKKGQVTSEEQEVEYFQKMVVIAKTRIQDFNNRKLLLSKSFKRNEIKRQSMISSQLKSEKPVETEQPRRKKKRVNPMYQEEALDQQLNTHVGQTKAKKKNPKDKLWQTIDAL